jgi:hypothetical protein
MNKVKHATTRSFVYCALVAHQLAGCAAEMGEPTEVGELQQDVRNLCPHAGVEMASFCQRWGQLPGGDVQLDIGDGHPVQLNYKLIGIANPTAYLEGDIILGDLSSIEEGVEEDAKEGVARISRTGRWPGGNVAYAIDAALPNPARVRDAIAHWEERTSLRFHERTAGEADFIQFVDGGGCSSYVGKVGGMQPVTLNAACTTGNAIHEIGHAIGLWHEQSRTDRDDYVSINFGNIQAGYEHNFDTITDPGVENGDVARYNFNSIMHYPATAFAVNPAIATITVKPGITLQPGVVIGQRAALSQGDVTAATLLYCDEEGFPCAVPVTPYL